MKFCCNPLCAFHVEAGDNNRLEHGLGGKQVQVRQYTIVNVDTGKRFKFCEVCTNAIALSTADAGRVAPILSEKSDEVPRENRPVEKEQPAKGAGNQPPVARERPEADLEPRPQVTSEGPLRDYPGAV